MRYVWMTIGVVITLLGALATLQGLGIVNNKIVPGDPDWFAIIGPVVAAIGMLVFLASAHRRARR